MERINALLSFYLHVNPDELTDEEWAKSWGRLQYALKFDQQRFSKEIM